MKIKFSRDTDIDTSSITSSETFFPKHGMLLSGICKDRDLVEIIEIPEHPWYVAVQFHPEFKSKPMAPHPLFTSFVAAGLEQKKQFARRSTKDEVKTKATRSYRDRSGRSTQST